VAFSWSESYQVLPNGAPVALKLVNCGKGRSDCATVCVVGKPA
jgi:hypothetical protein